MSRFMETRNVESALRENSRKFSQRKYETNDGDKKLERDTDIQLKIKSGELLDEFNRVEFLDFPYEGKSALRFLKSQIEEYENSLKNTPLDVEYMAYRTGEVAKLIYEIQDHSFKEIAQYKANGDKPFDEQSWRRETEIHIPDFKIIGDIANISKHRGLHEENRSIVDSIEIVRMKPADKYDYPIEQLNNDFLEIPGVFISSLKGRVSVISLFQSTFTYFESVYENNQNVQSPLHDAVQNKDIVKIKEILDLSKYDINSMNADEWTPLHTAIYSKCDVDIFKLLFEAGAKANIRQGVDFFTPLELAIIMNADSCVIKVILDAIWADYHSKEKDWQKQHAKNKAENIINREDRDRRTPLMVAIAQKHDLETIKILIEAGAKVNKRQSNSGQTVLHITPFNSSIEMIEMLLEMGADASIKDFYGLTPLDTALKKGNPEIIKLFQEWNSSKD